MMKTLLNIVLFLFLCGAGGIIGSTIVSWVLPDDPPKPKRDTTRIDIQQQQMINAEQGKRSLGLDSLIMKIDSLKQKK